MDEHIIGVNPDDALMRTGYPMSVTHRSISIICNEAPVESLGTRPTETDGGAAERPFAVLDERRVSWPASKRQSRCVSSVVENIGDQQGTATCETRERGGSRAFSAAASG